MLKTLDTIIFIKRLPFDKKRYKIVRKVLFY